MVTFDYNKAIQDLPYLESFIDLLEKLPKDKEYSFKIIRKSVVDSKTQMDMVSVEENLSYDKLREIIKGWTLKTLNDHNEKILEDMSEIKNLKQLYAWLNKTIDAMYEQLSDRSSILRCLTTGISEVECSFRVMDWVKNIIPHGVCPMEYFGGEIINKKVLAIAEKKGDINLTYNCRQHDERKCPCAGGKKTLFKVNTFTRCDIVGFRFKLGTEEYFKKKEEEEEQEKEEEKKKEAEKKKQKKQCRFCEIPNARNKCAKCGVARYCDRECQSADWKEHQKTCGKC